MNKVALNLFLLLLASNSICSQKVFFCDSIYIESSQRFESTCQYYYNFYSEKKDSILKIALNYDTVVSQKITILATTNKSKVIDGYVFGILERDTIFKINYNNGIANGAFELFREGQVLCRVPISNGKKHGEQFFYLEGDASSYLEQRFENSIANGPFLEIKKRKIVYFCNYRKGRKNGAEYKLFDTGEVEWCFVNENGKVKDGIYYRFSIEGDVMERLVFKNGDIQKKIKKR